MNELTGRQRMQMERVGMPEQDAEARRRTFTEVNLGLTPELAIEEARRCLMCKRPVCIAGCPVNIQITDFIGFLAEGEFDQAAKVIKQDNSLPAICGRVCPQENQCEGACVLDRKGKAIAIGALERFVADYERENDLMAVSPPVRRPLRSPANR